MIHLITGASHTGKTALAQRMLEAYHFPYLSLDHLKMGLIRSGHTDLTPLSSDEALTDLLWPIAREMIKTAIENGQNLIVEGCYIPFTWAEEFPPEYLEHIRFHCLVMTEGYIRTHFDDIRSHADIIEHRLTEDLNPEEVLRDNADCLARARKHHQDCILIDERYDIRL